MFTNMYSVNNADIFAIVHPIGYTDMHTLTVPFFVPNQDTNTHTNAHAIAVTNTHSIAQPNIFPHV
jgi:hypothetical protein